MASRCAGVRFKACAEAGALAGSCGGACAAAIADKASSNAPATELVMEAFMTSSPRPDRFGRPNRFVHRHGRQRVRGRDGSAKTRERTANGPRAIHLTGKSKKVAGKGSPRSVKCHHSLA